MTSDIVPRLRLRLRAGGGVLALAAGGWYDALLGDSLRLREPLRIAVDVLVAGALLQAHRG